jgi:TolB-like protein/DNA-binding winged helix-turn-helix (wHTH) protein/Flp pilus assembly protein TadD
VTTEAKPNVVHFGIYDFAPHTKELRKGGMRIRLEGQPLAILEMLLERPGELVTREELQKKLWPTDTFVDFEQSLNAAVKRLRAVLNDSADQPRYVETLARRGYRFAAPVQSIAGETSTPAKFRPPSRRFAVVGVAIAIVALLVTLLWMGSNQRKASAKKRIDSLAVLPLENLSRDPEQEYFSDGMTGALISNLSKIQPLRVISRTSTARYKHAKKSLPEIARELKVDAVIEGTVLRSGNRVRISVELIEAASDQHLWAETYDRELDDILKLQSEVAQAIAKQIQARLAPEQEAKFGSVPTINQGAYEDYLKGRFYWTTTSESYQGIMMAKQFFESSIKKEPGFALAYVGLADCYLTLGMLRRIPPQDAYRHGNELIHKALQLDENLGEAHSSLGDLSWQYEWNWTNAEREYRRALEINPNYLDAHEGLAWFLSWSGLRDEALVELAKMRALDPAFPLRFNDQAGLHYHLREYPELVDISRKAVEFNPGDWSSHYFLGTGYLGLGKNSEAISEFQKAVDLSQGDTDPSASLAYAYATTGRRADAQKILAEFERQSKTTYVSPYMIAIVWAGLGNKDKAFEFLEKAYQEKSTDLAYFIKSDLRLNSVRSDPRFFDLLDRMALPH